MNLYSQECLRQCCSQVYTDMIELNLQPGREDWVRLDKGREALEQRVREIWIEQKHGTASEWPWNRDFVLLTFIRERKKGRIKVNGLRSNRGDFFRHIGADEGTIYFIENSRGHIKIGWTSGNPKKRLQALQTGESEPLKLLATQTGTASQEQALHVRFAAFKVGGGSEWFYPNKELTKHIEGTHRWL